MPLAPPPTTASPLLEAFRAVRPGDLLNLAPKAQLTEGFKDCASNPVVDARWNEDRSGVTVSFGRSKTMLLCQKIGLVAYCTCSEWQPGNNCHHVVLVWATLKKLVSPDTLTHIRFYRGLLADMEDYLGLAASPATEPAPVKETIPAEPKGKLAALLRATGKLGEKASRPAAVKPSPVYRLVIRPGEYYGSPTGRLMRGNEVVTSWATSGLPAPLTHFLTRHYYYEPSRRYFEAFLKSTAGKYPIVFRNREGEETELAYRADETCSAALTLDLRGEEVLVYRSLAGGRQLPAGAVSHGELLFSPTTGTIHPVTNFVSWQECRHIIDACKRTCGLRHSAASVDDEDVDFEDDDDDFREEEGAAEVGRDAASGLRTIPHGVAVARSLFNAAGISLDASTGLPADGGVALLHDGLPVQPSPPLEPVYLLDLSTGIGESGGTARLMGSCGEEIFPCARELFPLLSPTGRLAFSAPLRAKKRVRALLDAAFRLVTEPKSTRRTAIVREVTSSPDFRKRQLKREAKALLDHLCDLWSRTPLLCLAGSAGWLGARDDRPAQVRLMRLLYESFGLDAFVDDPAAPGGIALPGRLLLAELPRLLPLFESHGFSLRVGNLPLARPSWEFLLDATQSGLDWFELHPEIRCDGELLTMEELRRLVKGQGIFERNGRLMLLDEASSLVLAMLAGSLTPRKKTGTREAVVRVPRLQILDWLELRKYGVTVKLAPQDARVLDNLLNFDGIPPRPLPGGLDATLRHYQLDAYRWLTFLYEHRFGACLADDMGLGKTLQGIALLAAVMRGVIPSAAPGTPHLVVAPPSLLFNWEAEIARFFPEARVTVYGGAGRTSDAFREHDVVITSYGIVQRDVETLAEHRFDVIIFDETQVVKNLKAATANAVRRLRGCFNLALTGTPLENHLGEYYAIMDLCLPGLLGSREEFSRQAGQEGAESGRLVRRTRPFVLRRTKELIAAELPPKIETDIQLELSPKQKALYQRTVEEVRGQVREAYDSHAPAQARIIALTAILRLRQICLAPSLAAAGASDASPKLEFLAEQLLELKDEGHSALVFSQFTGYLDLIERGLKEQGLSCLRLDGSTPVPKRKELVRSFQESGEPSVFLISLKAGGKGLNLTRATYVYHMDPWWNPAVENQASDRAHRIGQTGQVTITRLIMRHTIEEKMMALKQRKLKLYQAILEAGTGSGGAALTREDFEFLLG